jgi:hypothetical protein
MKKTLTVGSRVAGATKALQGKVGEVVDKVGRGRCQQYSVQWSDLTTSTCALRTLNLMVEDAPVVSEEESAVNAEKPARKRSKPCDVGRTPSASWKSSASSVSSNAASSTGDEVVHI